MFSRIYPDGKTDTERNETRRIIESVSKSYPDVLNEMRSSPRQIRNFLKKTGTDMPPGVTTRQLPYVNASGPNLYWCMSVFARKLFTALHYKHTDLIVPAGGGIVWTWYANTQFVNGEVPEELFSYFTGWQQMQRRKIDLGEQFNYYVIGPSNDGQVAGYFVAFRFAFAIFGYVNMDIRNFDPSVEEKDILRPLVHVKAPPLPRNRKLTAGT